MKKIVVSDQPVSIKSEKPEITCNLHILEYRGWRCKFWEERLGQEVCNQPNGPIFCHTGGKPSRPLSEQELEQMRVQQ